MDGVSMYKTFHIGGLHFSFGTKAIWKPALIGVVKHCVNGLRFNCGGTFLCVMWPK